MAERNVFLLPFCRWPGCLIGIVALFPVLWSAACRPKPAADATAGIHAEAKFDPAPPKVGTCQVTIKLTTSDGEPVRLNKLTVEGDMNHAGMRPTFAEFGEDAPGVFRGPIEFTMGGDWILLLSGQSATGANIKQRIEVPGVREP